MRISINAIFIICFIILPLIALSGLLWNYYYSPSPDEGNVPTRVPSTSQVLALISELRDLDLPIEDLLDPLGCHGPIGRLAVMCPQMFPVILSELGLSSRSSDRAITLYLGQSCRNKYGQYDPMDKYSYYLALWDPDDVVRLIALDTMGPKCRASLARDTAAMRSVAVTVEHNIESSDQWVRWTAYCLMLDWADEGYTGLAQSLTLKSAISECESSGKLVIAKLARHVIPNRALGNILLDSSLREEDGDLEEHVEDAIIFWLGTIMGRSDIVDYITCSAKKDRPAIFRELFSDRTQYLRFPGE